jgi:2-phosphosulfolactate phosphatase
MQETVVIDCFPESVKRYRKGYGVVVIDVVRATTTAVTAVAMGRRCFPVPCLETAFRLRGRLDHALLVGELGGRMPDGFDMNNSPAELELRSDIFRPAILLSSSGTTLIHAAGECAIAYLACFRNYTAVASHLAGRHTKVAIIGAGSRGEFREEDQMCCAWIARDLIKAGYQPKDDSTVQIVERWKSVPPSACLEGKSANYLRESGQVRDLDFILAHVNDLDAVFTLQHNEVVMVMDRRSREGPPGSSNDQMTTTTK